MTFLLIVVTFEDVIVDSFRCVVSTSGAEGRVGFLYAEQIFVKAYKSSVKLYGDRCLCA